MATIDFVSVTDSKRREAAEKSLRIVKGSSLFVEGATFQVIDYDFEEGFEVSNETGEPGSNPSTKACPILVTDKCGSLYLSVVTNIFYDIDTKMMKQSEGTFSDLVRSVINDYKQKYLANKKFDACDKVVLQAIVDAVKQYVVRVERPAPITHLDYYGKPRTRQLVNLYLSEKVTPTITPEISEEVTPTTPKRRRKTK